MSNVHADLRSYYEAEACQQLRRSPRGRRVELRNEYVEFLRREGRVSVVDFGAGPGGDGRGFIEAGCSYVGVDLAHGNAVLAAEAGVTVVHGSIAAPPLRSATFDAGWSMSTLMHIPEHEVLAVLREMILPLRPGAPFLVGLWGASVTQPAVDHIADTRIAGEQRLFSLRSFDTNRELLSSAGVIESETVWDVENEDWDYHVFRLRVP